ncbi:MAG: YkgJ family cysteine cluster protein [Desulfovibrionales bacterium]|nr:YkgJ family cysteine cluster protein [Desulfovibrionales bacterium]
MKLDLTTYFTEYESLVAQIDALFKNVSEKFADEVKCKEGCSDCCHALFDIPLVEALYLNAKFQEVDEKERNKILIEADKADRKANVLKKKISKDAEQSESADILGRVAQERIRCPLLSEVNVCQLYAFRPITCRVYGIPLEIEGKSHTCGLSGFIPGNSYPAVKIHRVQDELLRISNQILDDLGSKYADFRLMHVPVSTALMTMYNDEYFGLSELSESENVAEGEND